jgi:uncharacterized protein (DUF1810 family)
VTSDEQFNLEQFVTEQAPVFETVLVELQRGESEVTAA